MPKTPKPAKADKEPPSALSPSHSSKSGKGSKSSKSSKAHVKGKAGKASHNDGLYGMGKVTGFDVEKSNGVDGSLYSGGSGLGLMVSLVASVLFLARQ